MSTNLSELPKDLPRPLDDGAAAHLQGMRLPDVVLRATDGSEVSLAEIPGRATARSN
jgi:peroxiredoxin (alkyl hydroperoxide reductase subunit C)